MACSYVDMRVTTPLLLLLLVASLTTVTLSSWVGDYASNQRCGETIVEQKCDPGSPAANRACSDACHYDGCGGGRCVYLGSGGAGSTRGCHCLP